MKRYLNPENPVSLGGVNPIFSYPRLSVNDMAIILGNSAPAMQIKNQVFFAPVSYTDRWRNDHERN